MREKDFDIKNPRKKFQKTERVPPEGYECANDFFEDMYMDEDMIWMGQNTNHLHDDTIADAMIEAIREKIKGVGSVIDIRCNRIPISGYAGSSGT